MPANNISPPVASASSSVTCAAAGRTPRRYGNAHPQLAPYEVFACQDDRITIGVGNDRQFTALARVLGRPEWPMDERFRHNADRVAHRSELAALMQQVLRQRPAAAWLAALTERQVPCGPIRTVDEALASPEADRSGAVVRMDHPTVPDLPQLRLPWRFSRRATRPRTPPPLHGQHTRQVLAEAGFDASDILQALQSGAALQTDEVRSASP
jgi:formyl-CoA transferase/CoA:oxalate CoA-transferase